MRSALSILTCSIIPLFSACSDNTVAIGCPIKLDGGEILDCIRYKNSSIPSSEWHFYVFKRNDDKSLMKIELDSPTISKDEILSDELLGDNGKIDTINDISVLTSAIFSIPNSNKIETWNRNYHSQKFKCSKKYSDNYNTVMVECISSSSKLSFKYDRDRRIIEYQDFCAKGICTFKLQGGEGVRL